jgi:hypothetical protein
MRKRISAAQAGRGGDFSGGPIGALETVIP